MQVSEQVKKVAVEQQQQKQELNVNVDLEDKEDFEDESKLPFPKATIVNMLRKHLSQGKQIKGQVKTELNLWLGRMVERVANKLNEMPYSYVDGAMFRQAIESYENIQDIEKEKERIIKQLEAIKAACDVLILEVDRKFVK
ncbi:MAG: hypothetical protein QXX06_03755 [Candidatus Diapherotrites archaeon]